MVRPSSDAGIADGYIMESLVRHEGLLNLLNRIERCGFCLQMDARPVDRQFPYLQRDALGHMFHEFCQAGQNVIARTVDDRETFFQLRHSITRLVQFITRVYAGTKCLLILRLESAREVFDRRIFEGDAYGEIS